MFFICIPLHLGTVPLHTPDGSHSKPGGPVSLKPHWHLNTARPQADVFNSTKLRCGSSKIKRGHWTAWHVGGGDDQLPEAKHVAFTIPSTLKPGGQRYIALWPSLLPSKRNVSGGAGSGSCGQVDCATAMLTLLVRPLGDVQVNVPESLLSMSLMLRR